MCTRLHAIGFPCEMDRRTAQFLSDASLNAKRRVRSQRGEYRIWRSTAGAEIWLHYASPTQRQPGAGAAKPASSETFDPIGALSGFSVTHAGDSDIRMQLARTLGIAPANPLDGIGIATLESRVDGEGPIAFTFEMLNYAGERLVRGADVRLQVTAIAHRLWAFASERDYLAALPSERLIAKGCIADVTPGEVPDVPLVYRPKPGALWLLTGDIKRSVRLVNSVTSRPYYLICLATNRGQFDVIANPDTIEGDVSTGHVMQVLASVTGRVIEQVT